MEEHTIPLVPQEEDSVDFTFLANQIQNVDSSIVYQTEFLTESYYNLAGKLDSLIVSNTLCFIVLIVTLARVVLGSAASNLRKSGKAVR